METWFVCLMLVFAGVFVQSTRGSSELLSRDRRAADDPKLNADEVKEILSEHNRLRAAEGASDMQALRWNDVLASMAADWAKQCIWDHGNVAIDPRSGLGYKGKVGQNIFSTTADSISLKDAVKSWHDEKQMYTYDDNTCRPKSKDESCGHYTQVVWADTYELGCAYIKCPTLHKSTFTTPAFYVVCNYGPGGNSGNPTKQPFQKGPGCKKCSNGQFWCSQNLCNRDCSSSAANCECSPPCQNGGTADPSSCSCKCATGWTGIDCSRECKNYAIECTPPMGQPGWDFSFCDLEIMREETREKCPLMCKLCT